MKIICATCASRATVIFAIVLLDIRFVQPIPVILLLTDLQVSFSNVNNIIIIIIIQWLRVWCDKYCRCIWYMVGLLFNNVLLSWLSVNWSICSVGWLWYYYYDWKSFGGWSFMSLFKHSGGFIPDKFKAYHDTDLNI
jgi:hypothetical protein